MPDKRRTVVALSRTNHSGSLLYEHQEEINVMSDGSMLYRSIFNLGRNAAAVKWQTIGLLFFPLEVTKEEKLDSIKNAVALARPLGFNVESVNYENLSNRRSPA